MQVEENEELKSALQAAERELYAHVSSQTFLLNCKYNKYNDVASKSRANRMLKFNTLIDQLLFLTYVVPNVLCTIFFLSRDLEHWIN